jgi:hypothetical protein
VQKFGAAILMVMCCVFTASAQDKYETWGYRFPKASFRLSLFMPELSLETASKHGSTFVLGVGSSADFYDGEVTPRPYIYAQYRYYFKTPNIQLFNDGNRAEGFYLLGGLYGYQSRISNVSGSFILGAGGGCQLNFGKHFFTDLFVTPGLALVSNGEKISFAPAVTAGIKIGVELTGFEDED